VLLTNEGLIGLRLPSVADPPASRQSKKRRRPAVSEYRNSRHSRAIAWGQIWVVGAVRSQLPNKTGAAAEGFALSAKKFPRWVVRQVYFDATYLQIITYAITTK
jgi:hypothetical protein